MQIDSKIQHMQLPFVQGSCNLLFIGSNPPLCLGFREFFLTGKAACRTLQNLIPQFCCDYSVPSNLPAALQEEKCIFHPGSCLSNKVNPGKRGLQFWLSRVSTDIITICSSSVFFSQLYIYKTEMHLKEFVLSAKEPQRVQMKSLCRRKVFFMPFHWWELQMQNGKIQCDTYKSFIVLPVGSLLVLEEVC